MTLASDAEVKLVADTTVCRAAPIAFDTHLLNTPPGGQVIVLEIGPTRRIVVKALEGDSRRMSMLFDQAYSTLISFLIVQVS